MTPSPRLSRPDIEKLSAYLDGVLPPGEAAALEVRLAAEADLRGALDDLRFVARSLRRLPPVPVPRNFTLSREALPVRRGHPYPVLPFATALATLAFLVVFGWDAWVPQAASLVAHAPASELQQDRALDAATDEVLALEMAAPAAGEAGTPPTLPAEAYRFGVPEPTPCPGCPGPTPVTPDGDAEPEESAALAAATPTPTPT
ncbi:MAG: anti-sigma factor family protein, partial [Anaerolineales bacterium]